MIRACIKHNIRSLIGMGITLLVLLLASLYEADNKSRLEDGKICLQLETSSFLYAF